jgi:hypothetical protein
MKNVSIYIKIKYNLEFFRHTNTKNKNHIVTNEDLRLREVLLQNYLKSFTITNIIAFYLNYLRKNKSLIKTVISKILIYN